MKRLPITIATAAILCLGFAQTSQAQFRISFGNGVQFDSRRGVSINPHGGSGYRTYPHYGHGRHDDHRYHKPVVVHRDYYRGAHHVVRISNDRFRGGYYERDGKCYYYAGHGQPEVIRFGSFSHVDDLALRLEYLTQELCLDMHYNYRHNRDFRITYAEVYELYQLAKYIHAEEHHGHRDEIRRQLGGIDALFHHIQEDVCNWHRHHRRQIGSLGIEDKMDRIESTIHHLMNDLGVAATPGLEEPPVPAGNGLDLPPLP